MIGDRNEDGSIAHIVYGCLDTTDSKLQSLAQQKKISEFETEIYYDSLSKVRNRKYLDDKLIYEPCRAVVMADIDLFKNINDTVGHQCGDDVIAKVAAILEQAIRKEDVVIRYGGDEFMMAFFDITREDLESKLSYLNEAVKEITPQSAPDVKVTMSFGGAYGTELVNNLIATADKALYESKKKRDTYTVKEI